MKYALDKLSPEYPHIVAVFADIKRTTVAEWLEAPFHVEHTEYAELSDGSVYSLDYALGNWFYDHAFGQECHTANMETIMNPARRHGWLT